MLVQSEILGALLDWRCRRDQGSALESGPPGKDSRPRELNDGSLDPDLAWRSVLVSLGGQAFLLSHEKRQARDRCRARSFQAPPSAIQQKQLNRFEECLVHSVSTCCSKPNAAIGSKISSEIPQPDNSRCRQWDALSGLCESRQR